MRGQDCDEAGKKSWSIRPTGIAESGFGKLDVFVFPRGHASNILVMVAKKDAGGQDGSVQRGQQECLRRRDRKGGGGEEGGGHQQAEEYAGRDPEMEAVLDRQHVVPAGYDSVIERDVLLSGEGERTGNSNYLLSEFCWEEGRRFGIR